MEVADSIDRWHVLLIATSVTSWVGRVDLSDGVEWLMDVSNVVNHKTESKGQLVLLVAEVAGNLVDIVALTLSNFALEEASQVIESTDNIVVWLSEVVVIE